MSNCQDVKMQDEEVQNIFDRTVIESLGIKIWHLVFIIFAVAIIITIVACCIFRCRIPRTRQEIEADLTRGRVTKQFRKHLNKLPYDNICLLDVLNQIKTLEECRMKSGGEEQNYTLMQRFKLWLVKSQKDTAENSSFEKQTSVDLVKEKKVSLSNVIDN